MKRLFYLSLLTCCMILSAGVDSYAGVYEISDYLPIKTINPGNTTGLTIHDPRYSDPSNWVMGVVPFETTRRLKVRLAYGRQSQSDRSTNYWKVRIKYTERDDVAGTSSSNNYLTVSYNAGNPEYESVNIHSVSSGIIYINVDEVDYLDANNNPVAASAIPNDIQVEAILETTEYSSLVNSGKMLQGNFNTTSTPFMANTSITPSIYLLGQADNHQLITWSFIEGAESYDLEWVYIDKEDASYNDVISSSNPDPFSVNDPVRINTTDNYYMLDMNYPAGVVYFRVRGVGHFFRSVGGSNPAESVLTGDWNTVLEDGSTSASVQVASSFEGDKTWELVKSYAEGGKNKKVITYYDETSRARQSLTNLSTNNTVIVAEKKYDYEGRPTVSVLPFPISSIDMSYRRALESSNTPNAFSKADFDMGTSPTLLTSSGAGQYYSANMPQIGNAINQNYTPDAGGHPYTQVIYGRDNRNRPMRQSGVGADHALYGEHDTKYYYETAKDGELYRLFGANVGQVSHYKKNYVQDANGQLSVSYLDQEGRTIATALAGVSPINVNPLSYGLNPDQVTVNLASNNLFDIDNQKISSINEIMNTVVDNPYTFNYDATEALAPSLLCQNCKYHLEITITDPEGNNIIGSTSSPASLNIVTTNGTITGNEITQEYSINQTSVPSLVTGPGGVQTITYSHVTCTNGATTTAASPITFTVTFHEIGGYVISKVLTVIQPPASDILAAITSDPANQSLLDTVAILKSLLDSTNFNTCNVTCEQQCNNDPDCIAKCKNHYAMTMSDSVITSECSGYWAQMKAEMSPGGIYYQMWVNDASVQSMYATTGPCPVSSMNPLAAAASNILPVITINNGVGNVLDTVFKQADGSMFASAADLIDSLKNPLIFQSDWADSLVRFHPEYCHYMMCMMLSAANGSTDYDNKMAAFADKATFEDSVTYTDPIFSLSYNGISFSYITLNTNSTLPNYNQTPLGCESATNVRPSGSNYGAQNFQKALSYYVNFDLVPTTTPFDLYSLTAPPTSFLSIDAQGAIISSSISTDVLMNYRQGLYYGMSTSTSQASIDQRHWAMYRGAYLQLKQRYIDAFTSAICNGNGCQTVQSGGYMPDTLSFNASNVSGTSNPNVTNKPYSFTVFPKPNYGDGEVNAALAAGGTGCFSSPATTSSPSQSAIAAQSNTIIMTKIVSDCHNHCPEAANTWMLSLVPNTGPISFFNSTGADTFNLCQHPFFDWSFSGISMGGGPGTWTGTTGFVYNAVKADMISYCNAQCDYLTTLSHIADGQTTSTSLTAAQAQAQLQGLLVNSPGIYVPTIDNSNINWNGYYNSMTPAPVQLSATLNYLLVNSQSTISVGTPYLSPSCVFPNRNCDDRVYYWMSQIMSKCDGLTATDTATINAQLQGLCASIGSIFNNNLQLSSSLLQTLHAGGNPYLDTIERTLNAHGCSILNNSIGEGFNNACVLSPCFQSAFVYAYNQGNGLIMTKSDSSIHITPAGMSVMNSCLNKKKEATRDTTGSCIAFSFFRRNGVRVDPAGVSLLTVQSGVLAADPITTAMPAYQYEGMYVLDSATNDTLYVFQKLDTNDCQLNFVKCDWSLDSWRDDCIAYLNEQANYDMHAIYQWRLDSLAAAYQDRYKNACFLSRPNEAFTCTYLLNEYHYTLYYYDQAGNLVQTVPPEGVYPLTSKQTQRFMGVFPNYTAADEPQHRLLTNYKYNSLNQVISQNTPDGGTTAFWYNSKGQLRLSQNAKQLAAGTYSFTLYDGQGRIFMVAEAVGTPTADPSSTTTIASLDDYEWPYPLNVFPTLNDATLTTYDAGSGPCGAQHNVRGRVAQVEAATTSFYDITSSPPVNGTYYSYDIHGNVQTVYQYGGELTCSQIDYQYDLISGKVNGVDFHNAAAGLEFHHRYEYDADNRITNVYTSHDNVIWDEDADYFYYPHGPLARTEIGQDKVQGLDYYYTIHGWLKGVNMPGSYQDQNNLYTTSSTIAYDPGLDGYMQQYVIQGTGGATSTHNAAQTNSFVAQDQLSYRLGYYNSDYHGVKTSNTISTPVTNVLGTGLYNGNITSMVTDIPYMVNASAGADRVVGNTYQYDQLNRINNSFYNNYSSGAWASGGNKYGTSYSYDMNGNIKTLNRYEATGNQFDALAYHYNVDGNNRLLTDNKLNQVTDGANVTTVTADIKSQTSTTNYQYDAIGNLISDASEGNMEVKWNVYGKIKSITKGAASPYTYIEFTYDGAGNRVTKNVGTTDGTNITWTDKTTYVRDASGNIMATYDDKQIGTAWATSAEYPIYGSSRLGVYNQSIYNPLQAEGGDNSAWLGTYQRLLRHKSYELSDHLGNVIAVISDWKIGVSDGSNNFKYYTSDVASATDYYPFGMIMPGRQYGNGYRFGYQKQEKDDEIYGIGNALAFKYRMEDARTGRFFSVDPLTHSYPSNSPYSFAENSPILWNELEGAEISWGFKWIVNGVKTVTKDWHVSNEVKTIAKVAVHIGEVSYGGADPIRIFVNNADNAAKLWHGVATGNIKEVIEVLPVPGILISVYNNVQIASDDKKSTTERVNAGFDAVQTTAAVVVGAVKGKGASTTAEPIAEGPTAKLINESTSAVKKPYLNSRPPFAKGQPENVWETNKTTDGRVFDPNTGAELFWDKSIPRKGQWDMGHKPGLEYRNLFKDYLEGKISKEKFLEEYRKPGNYHPESPKSNQSHKFEKR